MSANGLAADFDRYPLDLLADAALSSARSLGASHADFRLERRLTQTIVARDRAIERTTMSEGVGFGVRVIVDGAWGFASASDLSPESAARTAQRAVEAAKLFAPLAIERVELAPEPPYAETWTSAFEINPFSVPESEKIAYLLGLTDTVLGSGRATHSDAFILQAAESKFLANLDGSRIKQHRVRVTADVLATRVTDDGSFDTMGTRSPPVGRGWEFVTSYGYEREAAELPHLLEEKMRSPSVEPGRYDLVIHPTNLWLTIHESIGHGTEFDRALGYEAAFAGTSFATPDKLNSLQVGSTVMNVTGDREVPHGLSTVGYDDEGVEAQRWDIIREGVLVGYQLNRQMAPKLGLDRSNGCAYADAPSHVPLQRMPNVSLQPAPDDIALEDLIAGVDRGIYIVGDRSWSIDQQRYNFQFTGQRFQEIRGGKLGGQLRDVAYQGNTIEFWNSMEAVGGPSTYLLHGSFSCGKGQPRQTAPVSHGAPAALFRNVNVLNSEREGGK